MTIPMLRFAVIATLALGLPACASMDAAPTTGDQTSIYDDKINAALSRAAGEAHRQGAKGGSLLLLERVYKRNPDSPEAATNFAAGLRQAGELQKAQLILEPFAVKTDASATTLTEWASLRLNQTQYAAAETQARKAIAKDPQAFGAYQILGIALDAQEKYEDAEKAFRTALDLWQGDPIPVMNNLALNLTNQERLDEALDIMQKAKEAAPGRPEVERNLRIIRTLNESATGRPAPKPADKPRTPRAAETSTTSPPNQKADGHATVTPVTEPVKTAAPAKTDPQTLKAQPIIEAAKNPSPTKPASLPDLAPAAGTKTEPQSQ